MNGRREFYRFLCISMHFTGRIMSTPGRGRGYTGRHHLRDPRPGDEPAEDLEAARTLAELSPRSTGIEPPKPDKQEAKHKEMDKKDQENHSCHEDEGIIKELLKVDEQYAPLIVLLEQFSPGEDGIQFNRKLRHFESTVTNMCPTEPTLQCAFSSFRAAALRSSVTARKLAGVGASFTRQARQQLLRRALLDVVMEGTFTKMDVLTRSNPSYLINAANLLGDYFAEARLCNGNKVHILASPLLHYMKALLASDDIRAHRSLATQLMQNGRELLSVLPQELDELSISIRSRLLTPPPVSIIWLLLSADLCLNKFLPLPSTLQQFYASHLDLVNEESYSEVSYGSWKKPEKEHDESTTESGLNVSQISLHDDNEVKPKLRPILGAGAGLLRQEQASTASSDNFETWTTKSNLSKRYDLNSWRQEEEKKEEEPVFNPSVLPPNIQTYSVNVPEFVPQSAEYQQNSNRINYNHDSYLQQGDGVHIQSQYQNNSNYSSQGDNYATQYVAERTPNMPEKINNEVQKSSRKPMENWRREKSDLKEDPNRNRQRWSRQRSRDGEDDEKGVNEERRSSSRNSRDAHPAARLNRRNSNESQEAKARRHVSDVPRSQKYWDHDDRCDKDYNS